MEGTGLRIKKEKEKSKKEKSKKKVGAEVDSDGRHGPDERDVESAREQRQAA